MALLTRKEFALMCGVDVKAINVYVRRTKVILSDPNDKKSPIDTENSTNKAFLERRLEMKNKPKSEPVKKRAQPLPNATKKETAEQKKKREEVNRESSITHNLDQKIKEANLLKTQREAEIKLLDIQKKKGEALPTDFVVIMTKNLIRSIIVGFENSTNRLTGTMCSRFGASREVLAEVNQKMSEELQIVIKEAEELAKEEVKNAIKEYSVKRGKGERNL